MADRLKDVVREIAQAEIALGNLAIRKRDAIGTKDYAEANRKWEAKRDQLKALQDERDRLVK